MISVRTQAEGNTPQTVPAIRAAGAIQTLTQAGSQLRRIGSAVTLAAIAAMAAGCGNNYRPVVSSINPVGPAAQPTKYAVAISSPSATAPGQVTVVDVAGDTIMVTPNIDANPQYLILDSGFTAYTLHADGSVNSFGISPSLQTRNVQQTTLLAGSNPVSLFPQGSSIYIAEAGHNSVAQLTGSPAALKQEITTGPGPIYTVGVSGAPRIYALATGTPVGGVYPAGTATAIDTSSITPTNTITVGSQPTYGVMTADGRRAFILNKGSNTVSVINAQTNQLDTFTNSAHVATSTIPVGVAPVWADFAPTYSELLVLNQNPGQSLAITGYSIFNNVITFSTAAQTLASGQSVGVTGFGTSTFLNGQVLTVSPIGLSGTSFQASLPVSHANTAFPVVEAASGVIGGSVSIISIPLCSSSTVITNPNCDVNNPIDATGFGTVVATVPVGINPTVIGVLQDGSQAFISNAGSPAQGIQGSISAINLQTETVVATIPASNASTVVPTDTLVHGNPNFLAVTTGTPTGKVYVTSANSPDMTIIRTDTDTIEAHIALQGSGVMVRITQP